MFQSAQAHHDDLEGRNRAKTNICIGEFESVRQDADTARVRSDSIEDSAASILLYLISAITLDAEIREKEANTGVFATKTLQQIGLSTHLNRG